VQGSILWWQLAQPDTFHKLVRHANESDSVAFAPDGRFAEEGNTQTTTLWTFGAGSEPKKGAELKNGAWVKRLWFTPDSKWLVRGGSDGLELAECDGPKRLVLDSNGQVEDVAMDQAGSFIASGDRVGRLMLFAVGMR
jgi:WD40 repeat protein